jgi:hypothetical protein
VTGEDLDRRPSGERTSAGQHLEQHDAEGVDVAAAVELEAARLLGRHVRRRAHHLRPGGQIRVVAGRRGQLGDPEVDDLHRVPAAVAAHDEDVGRLEIAVEDAGPVRRRQAARTLRHDRERAGRRQRPLALEHAGQVAAVEVLHHDVVAAVGADVEVDDVDDVGMADPAGGDRLAVEPNQHLAAARRGRRQQLDRHGLLGALVLGGEHGAVAAGADLPAEAIAIAEHARRTGHVARRVGERAVDLEARLGEQPALDVGDDVDVRVCGQRGRWRAHASA